MEKRLIIAITLSVLVIVAFQILFPAPKKMELPTQPIAQRRTESPAIAEIAQTLSEEKETVVETEKYILTFSNIGGSLTDVKLKEYIDSNTSKPLHLVSGAKGDRAIFSMQSNVLMNELALQNFALSQKQEYIIEYAFTVPGRFKIVKSYTINNSNNCIELRIYIQNISNGTIYKDYDILGGSGIRPSGMSMGARFLEIDSMIDGKLVKNSNVKGGESLIKGIVAWTGVKEKYFCIILKPQQNSDGIILKQFNKSNLASGVRSERAPLYAGSAIEDSYILYLGPADIKKLSKLGMGFEHIVDYGFFGPITKFLLVILRSLHRFTRNWGLAIILLTCLINIVLFPLTKKSFVSMKKIQDIQPHMEKLRKLHKDNPQRLNKELADLYRQYNINPFGGCLPLLLQMPIFVALYQGLVRSIELKNANFLWIKDLSNPDFVNIPFKLPFLGNQIHVLPILMIVAMFIQQKLSTAGSSVVSSEQAQQQKIMLIFFPLFFGFLFYSFPSGLVLYWFVNTVLMTIETFAIKKAFK